LLLFCHAAFSGNPIRAIEIPLNGAAQLFGQSILAPFTRRTFGGAVGTPI
jgi:hypothetical protein